MPKPLTTFRQVHSHLCANAARLHKAISALPDRYHHPERLALSNQLVGVRTVLAAVHGGGADPTIPSSDGGTSALIEWWQYTRPTDWLGEEARRRHGEQLYYVMHRLVLHSKTGTVADLATYIGMPRNTVYFVLANPARTRWPTLKPLVVALGGNCRELEAMWEAAFREAAGRRPSTADGGAWSSRMPASRPDQDQG